jgi:hypothetical protein
MGRVLDIGGLLECWPLGDGGLRSSLLLVSAVPLIAAHKQTWWEVRVVPQADIRGTQLWEPHIERWGQSGNKAEVSMHNFKPDRQIPLQGGLKRPESPACPGAS